MVLGRACDGSKGKEVLWIDFQNGDTSDPEGPGIPNSLQHCGGCSGKGIDTGSLSSIGNATCIGMGDMISQQSVLCG